MSSIFDRLGDKLRNYMDNYNDDVFSNENPADYENEEEPVEDGWHYSPGSQQFKSSFNFSTESNEETDENESWFQKAYSSKNRQNSNRYSDSQSSRENSSSWSEYFKFYTQNTRTQNNRTYNKNINTVNATLEKDFMKLGLQFGASLEECKIARTKLLKQYHPDRVTDEMQKQKYTIMSQLVNESFQRIKEYYEKQ